MPLDSERIGIKATSGKSLARSGKSNGKPAPTTRASTPFSSEHWIYGVYSFTARMILTAIIPRPIAASLVD